MTSFLLDALEISDHGLNSGANDLLGIAGEVQELLKRLLPVAPESLFPRPRHRLGRVAASPDWHGTVVRSNRPAPVDHLVDRMGRKYAARPLCQRRQIRRSVLRAAALAALAVGAVAGGAMGEVFGAAGTGVLRMPNRAEAGRGYERNRRTQEPHRRHNAHGSKRAPLARRRSEPPEPRLAAGAAPVSGSRESCRPGSGCDVRICAER